MERNKGITLVSLVITIAILLILSTVVIKQIQGDGLLNHTKKAESDTQKLVIEEQIKLKVLKEQSSMTNTIDLDELAKDIEKIDGVKNVDLSEKDRGYIKVTDIYDTIIVVNKDGTIGDKLKGYTVVEYIEANGPQYINTGFKPNQDTKVEVK